MSLRLIVLFLVLTTSGILAAGCDDEAEPLPPGGLEAINVRVAEPPGAERRVLTALYAEAYSDAGAAVELVPVPTPDAALQAVTDGDADIHIDRSGRVYTDVLDLPVGEEAAPSRVEVAAAVAEGLSARGVTTLNRAPHNDVARVVCTGDGLRRVDATNLSELAQAPAPVAYALSAETSRGAELKALRAAYPGLFPDGDTGTVGPPFTLLREGGAECALVEAGAPQIVRDALVPVVDDRGAVLPNQAVPLANRDFIRAAPDGFVALTNRVTATIDDDAVREMNAAVLLDDEEPQAAAREALAAAGLTG